MQYKVGDIVKIIPSFLGEPEEVLAYVYEEYNIGSGEGVSVITENGVNLGGFSEDEQKLYLDFVKKSGISYPFTNVINLDRDFNTLIKPLFNI